MKGGGMFSVNVKGNVYHKSFWYVSELSAYSSEQKEDRTNVTKYITHHVYDLIVNMISSFIFSPFSIIYINYSTMSIRSIIDFFCMRMTQIIRIFTDCLCSFFQICVICAPVWRFKHQETFLTVGIVGLKIFRAGPAGGDAVLKIFRAGPAGGDAVLKIFRTGPAGGDVVLKIFRAGLNQDLQDSRMSRINNQNNHLNQINHSSDKRGEGTKGRKDEENNRQAETCLFVHSSTDNQCSIRKINIIKINKLVIHSYNH
jgi:hypothetical protein